MTVSLVLPSAESASLELLDATGRRWMSRDVGTLGAGAHRVELSTAGRIPAGLYFLRLTQGGRTAMTRVAMIGAR